MPRAKKDQQKVPTLKKTTVLCPSRTYYAMTYCIDTGQLYADQSEGERQSGQFPIGQIKFVNVKPDCFLEPNIKT